MSSENLAAEVAQLRWFHTMDLGHGVVTPGVTDPARNVLPVIGLPPRLDGLSVLDIGAWDGFYSFEAERRGAARVLATDSYSWVGDGWGTKQGFELARRSLGSRVEDAEIDVMELSPERVGTFDLVLFLGVLYHLRNPLDAIERVASVTAGRLILETELALDWIPRPAAMVFPGEELNADPTNWFSFNTKALIGLLRANGFTSVGVHSRSSQLRRIPRKLRKLARGLGWSASATSRRVVIHASKG